jgi:hypothetical protein
VQQVIQALFLVPQALVKSQLSNATSRLQELLPLQYVKNNQYFSSAVQSLAAAGVCSGDIHELLVGVAEDIGSANLLP